jgi:hypothetical protein
MLNKCGWSVVVSYAFALLSEMRGKVIHIKPDRMHFPEAFPDMGSKNSHMALSCAYL